MINSKQYIATLEQINQSQANANILLNEAEAADLNAALLAQNYPYFQTQHLLNALRAQIQGALDVGHFVKLAATYAADRQKLYQLLQHAPLATDSGSIAQTNQEHQPHRTVQGNNLPAETEAKQVLDTPATPAPPQVAQTQVAQPSTSPDGPIPIPEPVFPLETLLPPDPDADESDSKRQQFMQIIDRFVTNEQNIKPIRIKAEFFSPENKAKQSVDENEEVISDTLAESFVRQKRYPKAIRAYETLSLKNPEKSLFFANRIKEIKQIANQHK